MKRAIRTLICIIAAAPIVFGGLELGSIYARRQEGTGVSVGQISIAAILIIAGIVLLATSKKIAERFDDDLEE